MRRLSLSTKLFAAALPLVIAVGALLALTVRSDLDEVAHAKRGADLGAVWTPLVASINAIEVELDSIPPAPTPTRRVPSASRSRGRRPAHRDAPGDRSVADRTG